MKKSYYVIKAINCWITGEACGDFWEYGEKIPKPNCKECSHYIDYKKKTE